MAWPLAHTGVEICAVMDARRQQVYNVGVLCSPANVHPEGVPLQGPGDILAPLHEGGRLPLFHFDMYRLGSAGELFDIGWEDYLDRGGVCAVEWSENIGRW